MTYASCNRYRRSTLARAPALAAGRAEGSLVPLARLILPIRPLPLAKAVPFDLTLYGPPQ
ncbi:hypothetical protein VZ95_14570 [Elstera litoralis]|uniref:Uncharacterized protein n=1 Tax=Elstera litoralis TaxID=552518 RepID=A0A0F3ITK2_9PROT|nr:hypothetical protein [Elstera litoralis]KJV08934.1 hypothetical protein VZ95_14570 [Elstera litoralis]